MYVMTHHGCVPEGDHCCTVDLLQQLGSRDARGSIPSPPPPSRTRQWYCVTFARPAGWALLVDRAPAHYIHEGGWGGFERPNPCTWQKVYLCQRHLCHVHGLGLSAPPPQQEHLCQVWVRSHVPNFGSLVDKNTVPCRCWSKRERTWPGRRHVRDPETWPKQGPCFSSQKTRPHGPCSCNYTGQPVRF